MQLSKLHMMDCWSLCSCHLTPQAQCECQWLSFSLHNMSSFRETEGGAFFSPLGNR